MLFFLLPQENILFDFENYFDDYYSKEVYCDCNIKKNHNKIRIIEHPSLLIFFFNNPKTTIENFKEEYEVNSVKWSFLGAFIKVNYPLFFFKYGKRSMDIPQLKQ